MTKIESKAKLLDVMPMAKYYMDQIKLFPVLDRYLPKSNMMDLAPAQVLSLMIINIITSVRPMYKVSDWVAEYLDGVGEEPINAIKYNDDRLARTLDQLFECDRQSLMVELSANAIQAFKLQTDIIHNDSTTITFQGEFGAQIADAIKLRRGHNKDFRPDCRQIVYGLNITEDGNVPISYQLFDGNQTDDNTHVPNWEQLRKMLGKTDFIYVADCKLCNEENLDHIAQNEGHFVTVVPKNRSILKPFYQELKDGQVKWQFAYSTPDNRKPSRETQYHTYETQPTEKGYRLIWVLSSTKAELDRRTRERQIAKAEANLKDLDTRLNRYRLKTRDKIEASVDKVRKKVAPYLDVQIIEHTTSFQKKVSPGRPGPNSVYKECTKTTYQLKWQRNQYEIDQAALVDGTFPLITNTDKTGTEVLRTYKQQPCLEKRFSTAKSVIDIAPVFLKKNSRIEAMMFLYFIALMVISLIERAIRKTMAEEGIEKLPILPGKMKTSRPTWNNLRYLFRGVHIAQVFLDSKLVKQSLKGLRDIHTETLRLLGIPPSTYYNLGSNGLTFCET